MIVKFNTFDGVCVVHAAAVYAVQELTVGSVLHLQGTKLQVMDSFADVTQKLSEAPPALNWNDPK